MSRKHRNDKGEEIAETDSVIEGGVDAESVAPPEELIVTAPSPDFVKAIAQQKEMLDAGVAPAKVAEERIQAIINAVPDQGLGPGDGLDQVARILSFPLPEEPNVVLAPGENPAVFLEKKAESMVDAWNQAADTKPAQVIQVGSLRNDPLVKQSDKAVVGVKKQITDEQTERLKEGVRQNGLMYEKSLWEENAKGIYTDEASMAGGMQYDPDPISRVMGLTGYVVDQTWEWFHEPGRYGQQLSVTRYYFQTPPLRMPLAIDIFANESAEIDHEIAIKQTLLPMKGIIYWALRPGQHITKSMRDMVMIPETEKQPEAISA